MIRSLMAQRGWAALLAVASLFTLSACDSSDDGDGGGGNFNMRVLNATSDVPSLDVYLNETKNFSAAVPDTPTAYSSHGAATYSVKVTNAGDATALFSDTWSFSPNLHYTGIVWGRTGSLRFATLPESDNVDSLPAGSGAMRVFNATTDSGTLDVYVTSTTVDVLDGATPSSGAIAPNSLGGYRSLSAGDYRLWVTGVGDPGDVRLKVPVTITAKQYATLIITAGPGGVLVNGALLLQQGALTPLKNTDARLRVAAGADARGSITMKVDGVTKQGSLRSPNVGPYNLVPAGSRIVEVSLNGVPVSTTTQNLVAGGDYTMLTIGTGAPGQVVLLGDDNRLPSTGRYRVRLINGAAGIEPASLSVDFKVLVSDITQASSSSFVTGAATATARVDVTASNLDILPLENAKLQSLAVYSVFLLGGDTQPKIWPVQDR